MFANNGRVLKAKNNSTDNKPQTPKPAKSAQTESSIKLPTNIDIGIDKMVDMKPVMAAPIPAMWPIGSMAIDLIFPQIKPKQRNNKKRKVNNTPKPGSSEFQNTKLYPKARVVNITKAKNDKFRIPKRNTKVPFISVEIPTENAKPAKT